MSITPSATAAICLLGLLLQGPVARAVISLADGPSPFSGNGHNVSFDGRIFITRLGGRLAGWHVRVFRPERMVYQSNGRPRLVGASFSPVSASSRIRAAGPGDDTNALAICEPDTDRTPYRCDGSGARKASGAYDCYDIYLIHSDALSRDMAFQRERIRLWIAAGKTKDARLHKYQWVGRAESLHGRGIEPLRGKEASVTRDGRLLMWSEPLMYATSNEACGRRWDGPHPLSHMYKDPLARGRYRLAERQLRAPDGTPYNDGASIQGAYSWLFPEGDAVVYTAAYMRCRNGRPSGCNAVRNALSVLGYPTNWGVGHIDGALNPSTTDKSRLFFSSPGPALSKKLPVTGGIDVWPLFGSNTRNYGELVFDDGLDGKYAGVWHMNESLRGSSIDRTKTPDTSGYFNTGELKGATFPDANNGVIGKAIVFDGASAHVRIPHASPLNLRNALTAEMWVKPSHVADCNSKNNYRVLLAKGSPTRGAYSLTLEDDMKIRARVQAGGGRRSVVSKHAISVGKWSHVAMTYDKSNETLSVFVNGVRSTSTRFAGAGTLSSNSSPLYIGGPGGNRSNCVSNGGGFAGVIDEVYLSRVARDVPTRYRYGRVGNSAKFVRQSAPASIAAGKTFTAKFVFRNVGTFSWSAARRYALGSQGPENNKRWGKHRIALPKNVAPGQSIEFSASLRAPATPGVYKMRWKLVQDGAAWFGGVTPELSITVGAQAATLDAQVGKPSITPTRPKAGQAFSLKLTVKNTGSEKWQPGVHKLATFPGGNSSGWSGTTLELPKALAGGQQTTVDADLTVPRAGTYDLRFRMRAGTKWFGAAGPLTRITVAAAPPSPVDAPEPYDGETDGEVASDDNGSVDTQPAEAATDAIDSEVAAQLPSEAISTAADAGPPLDIGPGVAPLDAEVPPGGCQLLPPAKLPTDLLLLCALAGLRRRRRRAVD